MSFVEGAPRSTWLWFADELQLGAWLLPVVPDESARPTPGSKIAKFGKVPSLYSGQGLARGFSKWTERPKATADEIDRWSRDGRYSLCVRTGSGSGLYALDIDVPDTLRALNIAAIFTGDLGIDLPLRERSNSGKRLFAFRIQGSPPLAKRSFRVDGGVTELLAQGQEFVAAGPHPSGVPYEWRGGLPDAFPEISLKAFESAWSAIRDEFAVTPEHTRAERGADPVDVLTEISAEDLAQLESALRWPALVDAADENDIWSECGYALLSLGETGLRLWREFDTRVNAARGVERHHNALEWWSGHIDDGTRTDWRHIFTMAKRLGYGSVADADAFSPVAASGTDSPPPPTDTPIDGKGSVPAAHHLASDQANARRVEAKFGAQLISVADSFYVYDGVRWCRDENAVSRMCAQLSAIVREEAGAARDIARFTEERLIESLGEWFAIHLKRHREVVDKRNASSKTLVTDPRTRAFMQQMATADELFKWAKQCEMKQTQQNCLNMLRALLNVDASRLDSHHHLLNCLSGTIDLRTGTEKAHDPADYITQLAPVRYNATARADRFCSFLVEILGAPCAAFLQRWFGYAATGETREQKILLHIGQGSNGKSTLFRTLKDVLGSYMHTAAPHLLASKSNERHPTEIADLFGKRCVTTHESEEGAYLRESFIKQASGEDEMSARLMYKDFFTFQPTFKLQLLSNHLPVVKGSDFAIWRRLLLCWYNHKYGAAQDVASGRADRIGDPNLYRQLHAEREGVLAWLVHGAVAWYAHGLQVPDSVVESSEAYRRAEDRAAEFVRERCIIDGNAWTPYGGPNGLYPEYSRWCRECGYQALGKGRFIGELSRVTGATGSDVRKVKTEGVRKSVTGCAGVRLNPNDDFAPVASNGTEDLL